MSSPYHQVQVQSTLTVFRGTELSGASRYVSPLAARAVDVSDSDDCRSAWTISPTLDGYVTGRNLLEPHHIQFPDSPEPAMGIARSASVGLVWGWEAGRP